MIHFYYIAVIGTRGINRQQISGENEDFFLGLIFFLA